VFNRLLIKRLIIFNMGFFDDFFFWKDHKIIMIEKWERKQTNFFA
jgi:hypothetical protein